MCIRLLPASCIPRHHVALDTIMWRKYKLQRPSWNFLNPPFSFSGLHILNELLSSTINVCCSSWEIKYCNDTKQGINYSCTSILIYTFFRWNTGRRKILKQILARMPRISSTINLLRTRLICFIQGHSPYLAVNALHFGYKTNLLLM